MSSNGEAQASVMNGQPRQTRKSRRVSKPVVRDSIITDYDDILEENELYEYECEEEERKAKKAKKDEEEGPNSLGVFVEVVPPEILTNVVSFISDPKLLLHLSMVNKPFRRAVSTAGSEVVVKAAVYSSKKATNKAMASIMDMVAARSIHAPSTFRLLRLLNGVRCEKMDQCYDLNLETKKSGTAAAKTVSAYGLCLCSKCENHLASSKINLGPGRRWNVSSPHERLCFFPDYRKRMLCNNGHKEYATNESVGPLVAGHQVNQIMSTYQESEQRKQAFDKIFEDIDQGRTESERLGETLVGVYLFAVEARKEEEEKKRAVTIQEYEDRKRERAAAMRAQTEPMLAKITEELEGHPSAALILAGAWSEEYGFFAFRNVLSQEILGHILSSYYGSNEWFLSKLQRAQEAYDLVKSKGFGCGPEDFLSQLNNSECPLEVAVYRYRNRCQGLRRLMSEDSFESTFNSNFIAKLKNPENGVLSAVLPFLSWDDKRSVFLQTVAEHSSTGPSMAHSYSLMAERLWGERPGDTWNDSTRNAAGFKSKFERAKSDYKKLSRSMKKYLKQDVVRNFLSKDPANASIYGKPRLIAVRKMCQLKHGSKTMLEKRDFQGLFTLHKSMVAFPNNFV